MFVSAGNESSSSRSDSCWSASVLNASTSSHSRPIDWDAIRENREKYETLKWQGEFSEHITTLLEFLTVLNCISFQFAV